MKIRNKIESSAEQGPRVESVVGKAMLFVSICKLRRDDVRRTITKYRNNPMPAESGKEQLLTRNTAHHVCLDSLETFMI